MKDFKKMIDEINIEAIEKAINILSGLKAFKEGKKTIEDQIFDLIKDNAILDLLMIKSFISFNHSILGCSDKCLRQYLFLAIMKGVHQLIEGDQRKNNIWIIAWSNNSHQYNLINNTYYKQYPLFFFFFSKRNAEKAKDILSNFFGINILDWWYK